MDPTELCLLSLAEQSRLIRERQVSPVEVVGAALACIDRLNPRLNAFITVLWQDATEEARRAEEELRRGLYRGPLHGIPVAVKDLLWTKGVLTTSGSRVTRKFIPREDAAIVEAFRDSGAVLTGKLNLNEYASGANGLNPHYGDAHNPWNVGRISGGSSSGSAVAVAASMVAGAIGTDTGGSIRMPASLCGIVGLKATYGRVSRRGVVPLSWSMDYAGPMTRTVEDAALMLSAIAGADAADPGSAAVAAPDFTRALTDDVRGLRVGVPRQGFFERAVPEVTEAVLQATARLGELGAVVEELDLPYSDDPNFFHSLLSGVDSAAYHLERTRRSPGEFGPTVRNRMEQYTLAPAVLYVQAQRLRRRVAQALTDALKEVDLLATPTMLTTAPTIEEATAPPVPGAASPTRSLGHNCSPFNDAGLPAITLPCGFSSDGLPLGLQLAGRPFDEETVLRAAYAYEQATEWHIRRPEM